MGMNGTRGRARILRSIRRDKARQYAAAGIDPRDRQAQHRFDMDRLDEISRTRRWFPYAGEAERSDAMSDARRYADELTKTTGNRHTFKHDTDPDECGYRVVKL